MLTRRKFVLNSAAAAFALRTHFSFGEPTAVYRNPILGGDHPDGSPIRVGNDFYLTHSSFDYAPGLLIWHSTDLINWRPVAAALRIVNDRQEIDFYYMQPGKEWQRMEESADISGMNHNVLGGFLDVRPALCAYGSGRANFRAFRYWPEVKAPIE